MNRTNDPLTCDTLVRARRPRRVRAPLRDIDGDEVASPVTMPEVAGVHLLEAIPNGPGGGPVVAVRGVRAPYDLPVRLFLVTAELDSRQRRRVRAECADLEGLLAVLGETIVVPLVDHGTDPDGRPFLVAASHGPT